MQKVRIVTQSGCDLPFELAEKYGIVMMPDYIHIDGKEYLNNQNILPDTFYPLLDKATDWPHSSHPAPEDFIRSFRACQDAEDILCIIISARTTGASQTAHLAKKMLEEEGFGPRIHIFESMQVSWGMGISVLEAARLAMLDEDIDTVLQRLHQFAKQTRIIFTLKTLKYAIKGGRLGGFQSRVIDAIHVYPLLTFRDGDVQSLRFKRSAKQCNAALLETVKQEYDGYSPLYIFHADNQEEAELLSTAIWEHFPAAELHKVPISPVLGMYTGRGCLGCTFLSKSH